MTPARLPLVERFAALASGRTLAHSYLLVSRDAVSLEATARALLAAIDGPARLSFADALVIEPDGASLGIDQVREAREHLAAYPGVAPYRSALFLRAETMTSEAQNALLKVAEEPAERSVLLIAATDEERLLPTLRSRLQRVALAPLVTEEVASWLAAEHGLASDQAAAIAARSGGSLALARELAAETPALAAARALLAARPSGVAAIAKAAAADEIALSELLRALSSELAYTAPTARTRELWHRTQRLAAAAQVSPLSLRLQIAALFTDLPS